jgi:hypothetical protein
MPTVEQLPHIAGLYLAALGSYPSDAMGYYKLGTGRLVYYQDGRWFFEAGTGRPAFSVERDAVSGR